MPNNLTFPLQTVVIGLGHQSVDDHLPALRDSDMFEVKALVDTNQTKAYEIAQEYHATPFSDLDEFLTQHRQSIDVAVVAVPHGAYFEIIEKLASNGIHIIKEKPFAKDFDEAKKIKAKIESSGVGLMMTLQRRYNPIFQSFNQLKNRIGRVHAIEARYVMNIEKLDKSWRGSSLHAGGGALIDLGYHYVDLLVWYFGLPDSVNCQLGHDGREDQEYDVEDTALIQFSYKRRTNDDAAIKGMMTVSRVYPEKQEAFTAIGTRGHVTVQRGSVTRVFGQGETETLVREGAWPSALVDQLEACGKAIQSGKCVGKVDEEYLQHMAFIEACYRSFKTGKAASPKKLLKEFSLGEG